MRIEVGKRLWNILAQLSDKKDETSRKLRIKKWQVALDIAQKSKDLRKILEVYRGYPELLEEASNDKLIAFRDSLKDSLKKAKKNVKAIAIELIKIVEKYTNSHS